MKTWGEYADNPGRQPVKLYGSTYSIMRASETGLPETIANHGQALPLLGLLGFRNVTLLTGHMAVWRRSGFPQENVGRLKVEG